MSYLVKNGSWEELQADATAVRYEVFVQEQKVPLVLEMDEHDVKCVHTVAYMKGKPVATGRLLPNAHIGRMAVLKAHRGQGVGALILKNLIALAALRGDEALYLSAQLQALGFYGRYGFKAYGEQYLDANIAHQMMRYEVASSSTTTE